MDMLVEILMYIFVILGMITVVICIFEKQICNYLSKEYREKGDTLEKEDSQNKIT